MGILDKAIGFLGGGVTGGSLLSGALSMLGTRSTNRAQEQLARQQMAFQSGQTGTEYQRAVEDMRKAGLNPMLATKLGGASSATGAMAQLKDPTASAREAMLIDAQIRNLDAQATKNATAATTDLLAAIGGAGASAYALNRLLKKGIKPQQSKITRSKYQPDQIDKWKSSRLNKYSGKVNRINIDPKGSINLIKKLFK
jgi:hypothetical protein